MRKKWVVVGLVCVVLLLSCLAGALFIESRDDRELVLQPLVERCDQGQFDACGHLGELERTSNPDASIVHLTKACEHEVTFACMHIEDRRFRFPFAPPPTRTETEHATSVFKRACDEGESRGCLRYGQALGCGRGVEVDLPAALTVLRAACGVDQPEACRQLLILSPDEVPSTRQLQQLAARLWLDGQHADAGIPAGLDVEYRQFLNAASALGLGDLDAAEAALTPLDGGIAEVRLVRETIRARREGLDWPDASWVAWKRARRPDVRDSSWLPPWKSFEYDPGRCPRVDAIEVSTDDDLLLAAINGAGSIMDMRHAPEVVNAAVERLKHDDPVVALAALSIVRDVNRLHPTPGTLVEELSARASLATRYGADDAFFAMLALPPDVSKLAATSAQADVLEAALEHPMKLPRQEIYDRVLRAPGANSEKAFSITVELITNAQQVHAINAWLERGGIDPARRAKILGTLADRLLSTHWLVHAFMARQCLHAANLALPSEAAQRRLDALSARLERVYRSENGLQAIGQWPWPVIAASNEIDPLLDEVERLERLAALAAD